MPYIYNSTVISTRYNQLITYRAFVAKLTNNQTTLHFFLFSPLKFLYATACIRSQKQVQLCFSREVQPVQHFLMVSQHDTNRRFFTYFIDTPEPLTPILRRSQVMDRYIKIKIDLGSIACLSKYNLRTDCKKLWSHRMSVFKENWSKLMPTFRGVKFVYLPYVLLLHSNFI